jgi:hypothetical protein
MRHSRFIAETTPADTAASATRALLKPRLTASCSTPFHALNEHFANHDVAPGHLTAALCCRSTQQRPALTHSPTALPLPLPPSLSPPASCRDPHHRSRTLTTAISNVDPACHRNNVHSLQAVHAS